mgnify:CR=1 FL=1|tara:strand:+ start:9594 stop:9881 length:288 start_codon:yes stop_codon:yes gene_type:complete
MKEKVIREYIRKIISNKLSENNELTQEGIVSGILGHFGDILKKANDKRFEKKLKDLAASGPEGKKAAADLIKSIETIDNAAKKVDDVYADLGIKF